MTLVLQLAVGFLVPSHRKPVLTRHPVSITVGLSSEIPPGTPPPLTRSACTTLGSETIGVPDPGERKVIDTDQGAVIVTNVKGSFYAVNAKCPHLGE